MWTATLFILAVFKNANSCDLYFNFAGTGNIAYCTHSTKCVNVLNAGQNFKRLREVRVRSCNVNVTFRRNLINNIVIKDGAGKRCYGK